MPVPSASGLRAAAILLLTLGVSSVAANDPVSLTVSHIHRCVTSCVFRSGSLNTDIGDILRCGSPYLNDCYCATATPALREVESYATACASAKCEAGDFSHDLSGIKSIYASYCAGAGYEQGLEAWFAPAEATSEPEAPATTTQEAAGGDVVTTTQLTVVTQTTAGNDADTLSRVVVLATSTLWVDPSGATVSSPSGGSGGGSNVALGAGIGAGVGVALIVAGILIWLCVRRRRRLRATNNVPPAGWVAPAAGTTPPMAAVSSDQGLSRKPVATAEVIPSPSPMSELNGHGQPPELGSKTVTPPPVSPMSSPAPVPIQTRMWNSEPRPELPSQGGSPPPVSPLAAAPVHNRPQEMWNSEPRPELYGQGGSPPPNYHQLANTQRTELP